MYEVIYMIENVFFFLSYNLFVFIFIIIYYGILFRIFLVFLKYDLFIL